MDTLIEEYARTTSERRICRGKMENRRLALRRSKYDVQQSERCQTRSVLREKNDYWEEEGK